MLIAVLAFLNVSVLDIGVNLVVGYRVFVARLFWS